MVSLRHFESSDIPFLKEKMGYTDENAQTLLNRYKTLEYDGKYFEMFAVIHDGIIVGNTSLYYKSEDTVSDGIEILPEYRNKGYGGEAVSAVCEKAKARGYKFVVAQIRIENEASIRLHKNGGFLCLFETVNSRSRKVYIYGRQL